MPMAIRKATHITAVGGKQPFVQQEIRYALQQPVVPNTKEGVRPHNEADGRRVQAVKGPGPHLASASREDTNNACL